MPRNIFVVEDEHACETVLRRTIKSFDPEAQIRWEESAEEAIRALEADRAAGKSYDLIIADIFLSGRRTGIELWEACRDRFPRTAILITSSLPIHRFFDTIGRNAIAPPFLPKPYRPGECRQIIENLLR